MKLLSRSLSFSASQKRETISKFKRISSKIGYSDKNHDTSRLKYECVHCIVKRCWRNHTKIRYRRHEKLALQLKSTLKWFVFSSQSIQLPCSTVILLFLDSAWHCWMCHRISDFFLRFECFQHNGRSRLNRFGITVLRINVQVSMCRSLGWWNLMHSYLHKGFDDGFRCQSRLSLHHVNRFESLLQLFIHYNHDGWKWLWYMLFLSHVVENKNCLTYYRSIAVRSSFC